MTEWTDARTWSEWEIVRSLGQGGQGIVSQARNNVSGNEGCIKTLKSQKDTERRARFAREAIAYDTCKHEAIPRLLQSNALHHESLEHKLFIVTEFVPGDTLAKRIDTSGPITLMNAAPLLVSLLTTLTYLHQEGWVHRDIKPDNIILRDDDIGLPVLLDFGLSFREGVTSSFDTEVGQELGNRFLRLPELSVNSETKQDARSDIAFAGGILFYVLTGTIPATLHDERGRMPHQRPAALERLTSGGGREAMMLLGFFDRAFNPNPLGRYGSAQDMLKAFNDILAAIQQPGSDDNADDLEFIVAHVNRQASQAEAELALTVDVGLRVIQQVHSELAARIKPTYVPYTAEYSRLPKGVRYFIGFVHFERKQERFAPEFSVEAIGGEVVVRAAGVIAYRTELALPAFDETFQGIIRAIFTQGVRGLIEDPVAQVANRGYFKSKPLTQLAQAKTAADEQRRPLFLIIFDASHPTYSDLDYVLGAFLGYEATKDLVDEHFVTALVPSSQPSVAALVPANDPLEKALWLVLTQDGTKLKNERVYANRDEGLERVRSAVDLWRARTAELNTGE